MPPKWPKAGLRQSSSMVRLLFTLSTSGGGLGPAVGKRSDTEDMLQTGAQPDTVRHRPVVISTGKEISTTT